MHADVHSLTAIVGSRTGMSLASLTRLARCANPMVRATYRQRDSGWTGQEQDIMQILGQRHAAIRPQDGACPAQGAQDRRASYAQAKEVRKKSPGDHKGDYVK